MAFSLAFYMTKRRGRGDTSFSAGQRHAAGDGNLIMRKGIHLAGSNRLGRLLMSESGYA
jgi:hypothetical protein